MANRKKAEILTDDLDTRYGAEFLAWDVPEYAKYERGRAWYAGMTALAAGLLIYSVATANFPFALVIVMFSIMVYLNAAGEPRMLRFAITETGIRLGTTHRQFRDVSRFWLVYDPPRAKTLYVEFRSALRPRMTVELGDMNPNEVRELLAQFVAEDLSEDAEPLSDTIGRFIKL